MADNWLYPTTIGLVGGTLVGVALSLWIAIEYIEPAFDKKEHINADGAKALTAFVCMAGLVVAISIITACIGMAVGYAIYAVRNECRRQAHRLFGPQQVIGNMTMNPIPLTNTAPRQTQSPT